MENTSSMTQIRQVIEALEQKINSARRVPMTAYSMVDGGGLIDLIGQMRIALPKAVTEAYELLEQKEEILSIARAEANRMADQAEASYTDAIKKANEVSEAIHQDADQYDKNTREKARQESEDMIADAEVRAQAIILNAQQQAQKLLDENEITRRAQAYAMETTERAQQDADSIYNQACVHADKMLSGAAAALSRSANELAALRDNLLTQGGM